MISIENRHHGPPPGDGLYRVYVGRPSPYGNPYTIGRDGSREEVIERYREWLTDELVGRLYRQRPDVLVCWCAPQACHAEVLVERLEARSRA